MAGTTPLGSTATPYTQQGLSPTGPDPNNPALLAAQQGLNSQLTTDDIAQTQVQSQDDALSNANSMRNSVHGTLDGMAQQAVSASNAEIGEWIQQSKKSVDNASKAV